MLALGRSWFSAFRWRYSAVMRLACWALSSQERYEAASLTNEELVFRDRWGGLTLLHARNLTTRLLINNSTFVSTTHSRVQPTPPH
ncbi:unnamed protein product [Plutella xylostella]|uniref:(diamondback moth) hypothetical protein n=1 Tax=Plutella xylostella TaxID=51655 RepID=A0A8S4G2H3_PLUXY|nr:unnamed protein product [Plutella xylostella]